MAATSTSPCPAGCCGGGVGALLPVLDVDEAAPGPPARAAGPGCRRRRRWPRRCRSPGRRAGRAARRTGPGPGGPRRCSRAPRRGCGSRSPGTYSWASALSSFTRSASAGHVVGALPALGGHERVDDRRDAERVGGLEDRGGVVRVDDGRVPGGGGEAGGGQGALELGRPLVEAVRLDLLEPDLGQARERRRAGRPGRPRGPSTAGRRVSGTPQDSFVPWIVSGSYTPGFHWKVFA